MKSRILSFFLRITGLVLKLCLTLYMGRFFSLEDMGTYGLVAAFAVVSISILGFRLDFIATREVINLGGLLLTARIRDQIIFYVICYIIFGIAGCIYYYFSDTPTDKLVYILALIIGVFESVSTLCSGNLVALQKPLTANLCFFIRSSLWIPAVIIIGFLFPEYRNVQIILIFWNCGIIASLLLNAWIWRKMKFWQSLSIPINWKWIKNSIFKAFPIWIGSICLTFSGYVDRFIVETYLDRASVGIISFYSSFAVAVYNIMNSGVFSFLYPKLVKCISTSNLKEFNNVAKKMRNQAILGSSVICFIIAFVVPVFCLWSGKKELLSNISILWAMLFGVWIKCITEYIYYICYAKEKDKLIWIGNLVFVISSTLVNLIFISSMALSGAVYGAVLSVIPFFLWRVLCLKKI